MRQPPRIPAVDPAFLEAELAHRERLSDTMLRLTITGPQLRRMPDAGGDQFFRLLFPREPGQQMRLPGSASMWYPRLLATPERVRPQVRAYTVRRRPDDASLVFDVVIHADAAGPGMLWALEAPIGGQCAVLDNGRLFNPPQPAAPMLLAGDQTALPGIAAICERRQAAGGTILLALEEGEAVRQLEAPSGFEVRLVDGAEALAVEAALAWGDGYAYAYCCAEQSAATGMRRVLVKGRGARVDQVTFAGFWRRGRAAD